MWTVVATGGAPFILNMPSAAATLGWGGTAAALAAGYAGMLLMSRVLAHLHEHGGRRHDRYLDLAQEVLVRAVAECGAHAPARGLN